MSRICIRCGRPLVIFRGFWQCKHCIEEKETKWVMGHPKDKLKWIENKEGKKENEIER